MPYSAPLRSIYGDSDEIIGVSLVWELQLPQKIEPAALQLHNPALHNVQYLSESQGGHLYLIEVHSATPEEELDRLDTAARGLFGDSFALKSDGYAQDMADFIAAGGTQEPPRNPEVLL